MTAALRIATLAAGLVMASAAWADGYGYYDQSGYHWHEDGSGSATAIPSSQSAILGQLTVTPVPKCRCAPGWTLVYAATAHGGTTTAKCAAVGDLRDPE